VRRFKLISLVLIGALVLPVPVGYGQQRKVDNQAAAAAPALSHGNAEFITAAELKDYLYFIAADELEGRNTPSRGLDIAAKFIATHLSRWGLKPVGDDGTYFQHIALRRNKIEPAQTRAEVNGQGFKFGDDFLAAPVSGSASGPLVYVGHGWVIKSKNLNPYQGIDVKDKIVVYAGGRLPKGVNSTDLKGEEGDQWERPQTYAQRNGAKGMIIIPNPILLSTWDQRRQASLQPSAPMVEKFQHPDSRPSLPTITASERMLTALFQGEKEDAAAVLKRAASNEPADSFELSPDKRASLTVQDKSESVQTQNVVAVLEGSDPVLKNEYVAVGAHYDHVGNSAPACRPVNEDTICNGADDDGSGTVSVLTMADAFAHGPRPKRSILFVWHAGEEKGLWGSRYINQFPIVPLNQIITQLNIDMIGRSKKAGDTNPANRELSGPNEIYVIGSKMMSTELGALSEAVNKSYLNLSFNYKYDDPKDPNRFFFRSDHFNYAQKGIPIIFYFDGVHEDYHRPTDSPDKIDYQKMEQVARTIFATAWELANTASRPRVDKQLPAELMAN